MALGAQQSNILQLVIRQALVLVSFGIAIGLAGAFALTRVMSGLLFGVSATDRLTFVIISLFLGGIALLASYLPARRAAKVDPMVALRCE
jgi:ABC-type antimicrobial peptide transport system permease subunit